MTVAGLLRPRVASLRNAYAALSPHARFALLAIGLLSLAAAEETARLLLAKVDELPLFSAVLKERLLNMTVFAFFYMVAVSTVVTAIGTLYTAEDLPLLFASPVPEGRVFAAKSVEAVALAGGVSSLLFLAALTGFARSHGTLTQLPAACALALPPFLALSGACGLAVALLVARFLPARRVELLFQGLLLVLAVGIVFFLRSLEPERLFRGDKFTTVAAYLRDLGRPGSDFEPSGWITATLQGFFTFRTGEALGAAAKLYAACLVALPLLLLLGRALYFPGVRRTAESLTARGDGPRATAPGPLERFAPALPAVSRALLWKDALVFFRTPVFVTQSVMLLAVGAMYLYNIKLLPLDAGGAVRRWLADLFGALNIAMVAFVVASAALRLVFPVLSAEGRAFLVVRASPLPPARILFTKQLLYTLLFLAYAMPLSHFTTSLLRAGPATHAAALLDTALLTPGIVAINLGFGIHFCGGGLTSVTDAPGSAGGLAAMAGSALHIGAVLVPQAPLLFPFLFRHVFRLGDAYGPVAAAGGALSLAAALLLPLYPLALAKRRLESGEGLP